MSDAALIALPVLPVTRKMSGTPATPEMPAKIAISNQKGGVGKTTVAINIAGALNERGRDVLFVDLDPQGNATEGLGFADAYDDAPPSLYDVLTDVDQREAIGDLVLEHEEMDVVPSNIDMSAIEPDLVVSRRGGEQLSLALRNIEENYDYILIDSPPYLGYVTDNALHAAGNVLIPALAESTSQRALELLMDHCRALEMEYEQEIHEVALVANRVEENNEAKQMMEWFKVAFDDIPVFEVRKRVALQRSFSQGVSIFEYEPTLDMADVFLDIADTLDDQFGFTESKQSDEEVEV